MVALGFFVAGGALQPANAQLATYTAQGFTNAQANGVTTLDFPPIVTQFGNANQATLGVGAIQSGINAAGSSSGTVESGLQHVSVFAGASANAVDGAISGAGGNASGRSQSNFFINAPGLAGTQGSFDFSFHISGDVGAARTPGGNAIATVNYRLVVGTIVPIEELIRIINGVQQSGTGLTLGNQTITTTFIFGQAINFDLLATATVQVGATSSEGTASSASATADFANTFAWNGILDVRNAAGASVLGYTALDAEGADWSTGFSAAAPVPEPASLALLGLGLAGLRFVRRKRAA